MKKQFFRVKQLADQTFLRAEKSEVLNHEELQIADQRVEFLRSAISSINKKIAPNGPIGDKEKRLKKCLEYQLGTTFTEESREEKECALFQNILKESGRVEQDLAKDYAEHESKVEEMVYTPLQKVLENEFPNILKQKHNLRKYCLDKDSASNRYHATKKEALKDDMEEADTKVEQSRDSLAIEMFSVLARENEFSTYILQLLKLQRGYHESALKNLETIIPVLERQIGDSSVKRVFGIPLQEHLRITGKKLAFPLEVCITTLSEYGMTEEGLFRIAGGMSKVKRLKSAIDSGCFTALIPEYRDVHVLASTLKLYLRELPEPLLTFHLHKEWMHSMQYPESQRLDVVKSILNKLPEENRDNLAYLIQFLAKLTHHPENKMSSSNIAIVISPNLLWNQEEEMNVNMGNCVTINMLVELFIKEVNILFPDDVSKYVTITGLYLDEEPHQKVNNGRHIENIDASTESLCDSPRPNTRKKKPAAPVPPNPSHISKTDHDIPNHEKTTSVAMSSVMTSSYPSGSSTLNRPQKPKDQPVKVKATVGVNTDENSSGKVSRRRSFNKDDVARSNAHNFNVNLVSEDTKYVTQDVKVAMQTANARPVQQVVPQSTVEADSSNSKSFRTTVIHNVGDAIEGPVSHKPVAAPRQLVNTNSDIDRTTDTSPTVTRTPSLRSSTNDVMSKSQSEFGDVQLRRTELPAKPEIPARPASLVPAKRSSLDVDPTSLQRTQCSVYSVANKQQPSIVNVQNRNEKYQLGHDNNIAEKERFLGHQPSAKSGVENNNRFSDVNFSNTDKIKSSSVSIKPVIPPKSLAFKSNEKLNISQSNEKLHLVTKSDEKLHDFTAVAEKFNGSTAKFGHHTRTRSDGNIIDLGKDCREKGDNAATSLLHTPPSPRSLNKPTQPPPPPPVSVSKKPEPESTDF